jgi:hypothetical protein
MRSIWFIGEVFMYSSTVTWKIMKLIKSVLMVSLIGLFISCGPFFDRVTVIYGTVKDEKGLPVDSIIVSLSAGYKGRVMMETFSDENGEFQMTMDVPLKLSV